MMLNPWLWLGGMALVAACLFSGYQYGKRVSDGEHALAMQDAIVKADAAVRAELDLAQSRVDALAETNAFHAARAAEARRRVAPKIVEISNAPPVPLDCKYDDLWVRIDSANSAINAETGGAAAPVECVTACPPLPQRSPSDTNFPAFLERDRAACGTAIFCTIRALSD